MAVGGGATAHVSFVLSQCTRLTDRRTERPSRYRALHYMQSHGKNKSHAIVALGRLFHNVRAHRMRNSTVRLTSALLWRIRPVTVPWNRAVKCIHVSRHLSPTIALARMRTVVLVVPRRRKVNRCPPDLWLSSPHLAAAAAAEKMVGQVRGACRRRVIEHSWRRALSVHGSLARTFRETWWLPPAIAEV